MPAAAADATAWLAGARLGKQALGAGPASGDATTLAIAWQVRAFVHSPSSAGQREAICCCRRALDLVSEWENPMARGVLVIMLAEFGDACRAVQVVDDLGWPDLLGVGAGLERAGLPSPQC